MATLAPLSATPARQPFGVLDSSKLRSLQSIKNCQNALSTSSAPSSLKRRHLSPENSDSENVDPNILKSLNKRKRANFGDDVTTSKSPKYSLTTVPSTKPRPFASSTLTPRLDINKATAPASAPAAAGRSPTRSRHQGTLPRKRFAPPQFGSKTPTLSLAAALSGTLAQKKSKKIRTIENSKPKSWFFDIYEETEAQQEYAVNEWTMTQSAIILDISDDESKAQAWADRGKENIPPNDVAVVSSGIITSPSVAAKVPSSRKDMMTDEPRTPLGDLNAADYYPEGLDASSVVLVQNDVAESEKVATNDKLVNLETPNDITFEPETSDTAELFSNSIDLSTLLASSRPTLEVKSVDGSGGKSEDVPEPADIEIWESESAKDEKEGAEESIFSV